MQTSRFLTTLLLLVLPSTLRAPIPPGAPFSPTDSVWIGDPLGELALEDLTGSEADTAVELAGRLLLLEFFAHWCAPCVRSIPHLNELEERYGARGLTVLGVTTEAAPETERWIARHGARFAYGYDPERVLTRRLGVRTLPTAVLVDPLGNVVWKGHPATLGDEALEAHLEFALTRPAHTWSPELASARARFLAGELAAAIELAQEPESGEATVVLAELRRQVEARLEHARRAARRGDALALERAAERFGAQLAGLPAAEELQALVEEARHTDRWSELLAAQRRIRRLLAAPNRRAERLAKVRGELEALAARLPDTVVAQEVARALKELPRPRR